MKQKIAIGIHGFNVAEPELTVGRLRPHLKAAGYQVDMFSYGLVGLIGVWRLNLRLAKKLAERVNDYVERGYLVDIYCHSNGAAITHLAVKFFGANVNGVVCINPALKRSLNPAWSAKFVHVYYNDEDLPVLFGKWLRWLNPLARKARPWGEMGRRGYDGGDDNVKCYDTERNFDVKAVGHSGVFEIPTVGYFGPIISKFGYIS